MFKDDPMLPKDAMAMIQPWHPGMMWLINLSITEDEMMLKRIGNQTIPAASLQEADAQEALIQMHGSLSM